MTIQMAQGKEFEGVVLAQGARKPRLLDAKEPPLNAAGAASRRAHPHLYASDDHSPARCTSNSRLGAWWAREKLRARLTVG